MEKDLKLLMVEDCISDMELILKNLSGTGYKVDHGMADNAQDMRRLINESPWDIILCNYPMQGFDALEALKILRELGIDIPCIVVSRAIAEEDVIKLMKAGCHDCVMISNLDRLPLVINRELEGAIVRNENKALKESQGRKQSMIANISDVISIIDENGIIRYKSPNVEKWFGWASEELMGKEFWITVHPEELGRVWKEFYKILKEDKGTATVEYRYKCKNGSYKIIHLTASNLIDDPYIKGILVNYHDITDSKKAEREIIEAKNAAEAADKAKSAFLANMSHEIRTPLNGIMGMAQLMMLSQLNCQQMEYLNTILNCSSNLMRIIGDILDLSKLEADATTFYKEIFNLDSFVYDIESIFSKRIFEKDLKFHTDIDPGIPRKLYGDVGKFSQIVGNLIENAMKFTDEGNIVLALEHKEEQSGRIKLEVSVSDTGIGIPGDDLCRLFKPFSQVDTSSTRKYGGSGLGLAICKGLVEKNGGEMWAESQVGKGSKFSFTYYVDKGLEEAADIERELSFNQQSSFLKHDFTALIVEDDIVSSKLLKSVLDKLGIKTTCAFSGEEALEFMHMIQYDIIFLDICLPDMDGIDVIRQIRRMEKHGPNKSFVIAATANVMHGKKKEYLDAGMDAYLEKPLKLNDLYMVLQSYAATER
ncbi:MAG TPA: response regulator [Pseudobacteroides sp.]|uniref:response regulator n=1 Tax=Pseudobacteroides sp. TaxID=1968840 RepID=UPI002F95363C